MKRHLLALWNRAVLTLCSIALVLAAVGSGCSQPWGSDRPIAQVDSRPVTERQWVEAMLRKEGARELVALMDERLIRDEAKKLGIVPTPQRVRAKVDEVVAYLGSRDALDRRLNDLHMSFGEFWRRCETLALLDMIVLSQLEVTEQEIAEYYRAHHKEFTHGPMVRARMIMVADRASAEAILAALREGGDFAGLAKALSQDPATAPQGGDMGWFSDSDYAAEITKMAFSLRPGQVSNVFKGPDGWYILKVEDRRPPGKKPLQDVKEQIRTRLQHERLLAARAEWLRQKRKTAQLVVKDAMLAKAVKEALGSAPPPPPLPDVAIPQPVVLGP